MLEFNAISGLSSKPKHEQAARYCAAAARVARGLKEARTPSEAQAEAEESPTKKQRVSLTDQHIEWTFLNLVAHTKKLCGGAHHIRDVAKQVCAFFFFAFRYYC
jgi:hypothetical protein